MTIIKPLSTATALTMSQPIQTHYHTTIPSKVLTLQIKNHRDQYNYPRATPHGKIDTRRLLASAHADMMFNTSKIKIAVNQAIIDAGSTGHFILPGAPPSAR